MIPYFGEETVAGIDCHSDAVIPSPLSSGARRWANSNTIDAEGSLVF